MYHTGGALAATGVPLLAMQATGLGFLLIAVAAVLLTLGRIMRRGDKS